MNPRTSPGPNFSRNRETSYPLAHTGLLSYKHVTWCQKFFLLFPMLCFGLMPNFWVEAGSILPKPCRWHVAKSSMSLHTVKSWQFRGQYVFPSFSACKLSTPKREAALYNSEPLPLLCNIIIQWKWITNMPSFLHPFKIICFIWKLKK